MSKNIEKQKNIKKFEKTCWQAWKDMLSYQSCPREIRNRLAASKLSINNKNEPWKLKIEQYTNPEDSKHKAGFGLGFEKNSEQNQSNEGLKRLAKLIV